MENKKVYGMWQLNDLTACEFSRNFPVELSKTSEAYKKKAQLINQAIKDVLLKGMSADDAMKDLESGFEKLPYHCDKQRKIQCENAKLQALRYINCENRKAYVFSDRIVDLGEDIQADVRPTFTFVEDDYIEVVKLHCSKPKINSRNITNNLEMYALLKYARQIAEEIEKNVTVKASVYYLRKNNDRFSSKDTHFDKDFFLVKGGGNIVTIQEEHAKDGNDVVETTTTIKSKKKAVNKDWDALFAPTVKKFATGIPKEDLKKTDCAKCSKKNICGYKVAPAPVQKEKKNAAALRSIKLSNEQKMAVEYLGSKAGQNTLVRINAGAGTGKTTVVALRVVSLLMKGYKPEEIMVTTFTNGGAEEMRDRIKACLEAFGIEADTSKIIMCTYNSFGNEVIKEDPERFGFNAAPTVIDSLEKRQIIRDLLNKNDVPDLDYANFESSTRYIKGALAVAETAFDLIKANQYSVSDARALYANPLYPSSYSSLKSAEALCKLYDEYDYIVREKGHITFDDQIIMITDELLQDDPYYFDKLHLKHIIVDEFQDTNAKQISLLKALRNGADIESVMVVGDDSQAIYSSFRDADPYYIIHFDDVMGEPVTDIYMLENHRCSPEVIEAANYVNRLNRDRIEKDLVATRPSGKNVTVKAFLTADEESTYVVESVKSHIDAGVKPNDIMILAATNSEVYKIASSLELAGISACCINPEKYVENTRVIGALALIELLYDTNNTQDMIEYINVLTENRVHTMSEQEIYEMSKDVNLAIKNMLSVGDMDEQKEQLLDMMRILDEDKTDEVYQNFLEKLQFKSYDDIINYCKDLYSLGSDTACKRAFNANGVICRTAHDSKGSEAPIVYVMMSNFDGKTLPLDPQDPIIQEKRKLTFVAMTRARDELYVTGQAVAYKEKTEVTVYSKDPFEEPKVVTREDIHVNRFLKECFLSVGGDLTVSDVEKMVEDKKTAEKAKKAISAA